MKLRVIISPPGSGAWNMAVDEALLLSSQFDGLTLRFYQWAEPTLSLGYFQALAERDEHRASSQCPLVRRASGGGAILHDVELTYSIVAPLTQRWGAAAHDLYLVAHHSLCAILSNWGIQASLFEASTPPLARDAEPFLCFQRRSSGDVVLKGAKICGSAQRRHLSRVLQHGSLLLGTSAAAPELAGIAQLTGKNIPTADLRGAWIAQLVQALQCEVVSDGLSGLEEAEAHRISQGKFAHPKWTSKR